MNGFISVFSCLNVITGLRISEQGARLKVYIYFLCFVQKLITFTPQIGSTFARSDTTFQETFFCHKGIISLS